MYKYGNEIQYTIKPLSPDDYELLGDFDCGSDEINHYFIHKCKDDINVTYIVKDIKLHKIIGFASLCCSGIIHQQGKYRHIIPAILLNYFAIANEYQKLLYDSIEEDHFYFSDCILADIIHLCRELAEERIGAQFLILYSVPAAKHFYERNLFQNYEEFMVGDQSNYLEGCSAMYLELW